MTLSLSFTGVGSLDDVLILNDGSFSTTFYDGDGNEVYVEMDRETATGLCAKLDAIFTEEERVFAENFQASLEEPQGRERP